MSKSEDSHLKTTDGFGLIETLIASGISAAFALGAFNTIHQQQRQFTRMKMKNTILESKFAIAQTLSDSSVCNFNISSLGAINLSGTNTSTPFTPSTDWTLSKLYLGSDTSSAVAAQGDLPLLGLQDGPKVANVKISEILRKSSTTDTQYTSNLYITFKTDPRFQPDLQPMKIRLDFTTDSINPITSRNITNCKTFGTMAPSPPPATPTLPTMSCANGQVMTGISASGAPLCTSQTTVGTSCGPSNQGSTMYFGGTRYCCDVITDSLSWFQYFTCSAF